MAAPELSKPWFHGSPYELRELKVGSTITQDRELARVFSHKPALLSMGDDGRIKHNGRADGFLYLISETIQEGDIVPVPRSTMAPGKEWLTTRPLQVTLLEQTSIRPHERLSRWEEAIFTLGALLYRKLKRRH